MTEKESETLYLLGSLKLTVKQASIRQNCSVQAIYKFRQNLIKKGFLTPTYNLVEKKGGYAKKLNQNDHPIRLHAEQFSINIIWGQREKKYREKIGKIIKIDGNTIKCHRETVEIYSNNSFFGDTPSICDSKAVKYWTRIINNLQSDLGCILMKDRSQNIKRVRAEYAETNNELSEGFRRENQKVRVTGEDGKVWLVFDNSFNLDEMETTHPQESAVDMEKTMQPFFNDLRETTQKTGKTVLISELMELTKIILQNQLMTTNNLSSVSKLLEANYSKLKQQDQEEDKAQLNLNNYIG